MYFTVCLHRPAGTPAGGRVRADLAAEPRGGYDAGDRASGRLGRLRGLLDDRDRTAGLVVRELVALRADGDLPALLDGLTLQVWLEHHGRLPAVDARRLLGAVDVLMRMPLLVEGLCDRWVSFDQTCSIARAARAVPVARLAELDALVAAAMIPLADRDPDALLWRVEQWVDALRPTRLERAEKLAESTEYVTLTPRLFGGGGLHGELGPVNFATVAEALHAPLGPPVAVPDDLDDLTAVDEAFATLDEQAARLARHHGAAMAERLVAICERELTGTTSTTGEPAADGQPGRRPRPMLLATIDVDSLLDGDRTPGWLLHTLAGGRMKVSSDLLQRLTDERGADLRTVVLDDCGQVVGVGRKTYVPPGWLREAIWARDTLTTDPTRRTPVRRADLDHIRPWPDGGTDVDNLHPLGRTWHNAKTSGRWTVKRQRDGTTIWRHRRHGWLLRLAPPRGDLTDPPATGPPTLPLDLPIS